MSADFSDRSWPLSSLLALLGFVFVPAAVTMAGLSAGPTNTGTEVENGPDGLAFSETEQNRSLSMIDRWVESRIPGRELAFEFDRTTTRILDDNYAGAIAANDRVQLGRDGWLFLSDASDQPCATPKIERMWKAELARVEAMLGSAGKRPLVAIAPDRGVIAPDLLGSIDNRCQVHNTDVVNRLATSPIVIDLSESVSGEAHALQLDTHWSPEGAMAGARQIVDVISPGTWEDRTVATEIVERRGDLDGLLGYENTEAVNLLTVDQPEPTALEAFQTSIPGRPLVRASTPGSTDAHVLLIHDSYGGLTVVDDPDTYVAGLGVHYVRPWFRRVDNVRLEGISALSLADEPVAQSLQEADTVAFLFVQRMLSFRLGTGRLSIPTAVALKSVLGVEHDARNPTGEEGVLIITGFDADPSDIRAGAGSILERLDFGDQVGLLVSAGTRLELPPIASVFVPTE
ncbi:MAG: hypothetical protein HKN24_11310 [Acidimicrobiales bacterium]|nr:hypothetical protein [Acidimicrobiales bacterium]